MTSSFWLQGKNSEIDIAEEIGSPAKHPKESHYVHMNTHAFTGAFEDDKSTPRRAETNEDISNKYHTYAAWWKDERTVWFYFDGNKVGEAVPCAAFREPMYLIFDTEAFADAGLPTIMSLGNSSTNTMSIDWVRVWELKANL